jgi:dipeptidyl aminopeptidase/acylaminoacyl peptidase
MDGFVTRRRARRIVRRLHGELIAGNWPDRFRCLVTHDGNFDERFAYFATEELWFPEWEHQGTPWDNAVGYTKYNPIDRVASWKTPMLVA